MLGTGDDQQTELALARAPIYGFGFASISAFFRSRWTSGVVSPAGSFAAAWSSRERHSSLRPFSHATAARWRSSAAVASST
jgi:hypothetical protein